MRMLQIRSIRPLSALTAAVVVFALAIAIAPPASAATACTGNAIVCENQLPGTPQSQWWVDGAGDASIQGFATQISVDVGQTEQFKIDTNASAYTITIYRLGYYQGDGARQIATISPSARLPQAQPSCATDPATEIYDCGTWAVSASWAVPSTAVSGVYIARLYRADTDDASLIPFIVRNDASHSDIVYQTSDPTWQAYNTYGGSDFYQGFDNGRAYKISYNRPYLTGGDNDGRDFLFSNEYPTIRYLEANGYDVSYISGLDTDIHGSLLTNHKVFLSVGHDEYWSDGQRANVVAARDAGVNLAFLSGNEVYWRTRWEPSEDGSNTPNRTLVCYKDTWANAQIDPVEDTATWRDPRFSDNGQGPENALTGTLYMSNFTDLPITVSAQEGKYRLWRNTALANQPAGGSTPLAAHTVGYESDEDLDNGYRPAGLVDLSTTVGPTPQYLLDYGNTVAPGTTTHHLTLYRAASGALVFGAGTVNWGWGLDSVHDGTQQPADPRMQQATVNLLADMGVQPQTLISGLVPASKSTDTQAPTAVMTAPAANSSIPEGSLVTVTGTASDAGGGRVAGVEVSLDAGRTWHPATGTANFSYTGILSGTGAGAVQARATDDSANMQSPATMLPLVVDCPCSIFGAATPTTPAASDGDALTLGVKFTSSQDGFITGIRFYKGVGNTGTHVGTLYSAGGAVLASATFANETASGWQTVNFSSAVPITAGTTYVAAYYAPSGHYAADARYFTAGGHSAGSLTALGGRGNTNGVYAGGQRFPDSSYNQTNYYVDVVYSPVDTTPLGVISTSPLGDSVSVPTAAPVTATFSRSVDASSIDFTVADGDNNVVPSVVQYNADTRTVSLTPDQPLQAGTAYTARINASAPVVGPMAAPAVWSFTTANPPQVPGVCPCTLFDDGDNPSTGPARDGTSLQLGVAFTADTNGQIAGIRFYKTPDNTGTHTVALWGLNGSKLASATAVNEVASGWQEVDFSTPVTIAAGTTYTASYLSPTGVYSFDSGGLASAINRSPLHTDVNAGRYVYGSTAPVATSSANYYVDPVYTYDPSVPPQVTSIDPADGSTSVPVSASVTVGFSSKIQPNSATVTVKDSSGSTVAGADSQESAQTSVTFVPASPLASGQTYTVTVSGATSLAGTAMTTPFVAHFTTSGATTCPCTLFPSGMVPVLSDSGDGSAVTVGTRFTAQVNGFVSGLRFYRDAANTGSHTGALYATDGTKLADLSFAAQAPGWQTAAFSAPVAVTAGTTYVAAVYMPSGHYSAALDFFDSPYDNAPLTGLLGTYTYGSEALPTQSYRASNYYVDVVFTTQDTAPPVVTSQTPAPGTVAQVDSTVTATFARAIDPGTLMITLRDAGGNAVSGSVSYDSDSRTATFQPVSALAYATTLTASVSASSAAGVPMTAPVQWTFSTVAAPPDGTAYSIFAQGSQPDSPSWNDPGPVTVGVRFTSDQAGAVTAVKFYDGDGNTGPHQVAIWGPDGTQLGTGTSTGTVNGWRTVNLDSPVQIAAGTVYVASYRAPTGHYAVTLGGLAAAVDASPLHVPANGGTYSYPDAFPTSSSAVNFWVDVVLVVPPALPDGQTAAAHATATPAIEPEDPPTTTPPPTTEPDDPTSGGESTASSTVSAAASSTVSTTASTTSSGTASTTASTTPSGTASTTTSATPNSTTTTTQSPTVSTSTTAASTTTTRRGNPHRG